MNDKIISEINKALSKYDKKLLESVKMTLLGIKSGEDNLSNGNLEWHRFQKNDLKSKKQDSIIKKVPVLGHKNDSSILTEIEKKFDNYMKNKIIKIKNKYYNINEIKQKSPSYYNKLLLKYIKNIK